MDSFLGRGRRPCPLPFLRGGAPSGRDLHMLPQAQNSGKFICASAVVSHPSPPALTIFPPPLQHVLEGTVILRNNSHPEEMVGPPILTLPLHCPFPTTATKCAPLTFLTELWLNSVCASAFSLKRYSGYLPSNPSSFDTQDPLSWLPLTSLTLFLVWTLFR